MSGWLEHSLADARQAELRRQADQDRLAAACTLADDPRRGATIARVQQRLGMLLVETGLHLITRTGNSSAASE